MRNAEQIKKLIALYREQVRKLEEDLNPETSTGHILAWYSCKVSIADLYEELEALRVGNVERIRPNVDRRRTARKRIA